MEYQKPTQTQRIHSIDLIKLIAMVGVVALHTFSKQFVYCTTVIAIPLFFMAMGYVQLGRKKINAKYCLTKIWKIIKLVTIITFILWLIFNVLGGQGSISIKSLLGHLFGGYFQLSRFGYFWFFGAVIIIYLILPLLNKLYIHYYKWFLWFIILDILVMSAFFMEDVFHLKFGWNSEQNIIQTFRLYNWIGYVCIGGMVKKTNFNILGQWWLLLIFLILNYYFQQALIPYLGNDACEFFYNSIVVILLSLIVFVCCLKIKSQKLEFTVKYVDLFLPVYCLHMPVSRFFGYVFEHFDLSFGPWNIYRFLLVLSVTAVISYYIMKVPLFKRLFSI